MSCSLLIKESYFDRSCAKVKEANDRTWRNKKEILTPKTTVYIRAYAEQTVTERTDVYRSTRFFAPKMFFRSFKVTNANIETKLEQMCCIHTRLVVCAQEHNDFSGGSP